MTEVHSRIFSVAQELFAHHGYAGVSIADIAGKARIAKSTVLHHYPNKQKLYAAVVEESINRLAALPQISAKTGNNLAEELIALMHWMLSEPIHAKLLNRVFMDNPRSAALAARRYWRPLLAKLGGLTGGKANEIGEAKIVFCVNAIFQLAFSVELQLQLAGNRRNVHDLCAYFAPVVEAMASKEFGLTKKLSRS